MNNHRKIYAVSELNRIEKFKRCSNDELFTVLKYREDADKLLYPVNDYSDTEELLNAVINSWNKLLVFPDTINIIQLNHIYNSEYIWTTFVRDTPKLDLLLQCSFYLNYEVDIKSSSIWTNPVFKQILYGTIDKESTLNVLCGHKDVLFQIFDWIRSSWENHIEYVSNIIDLSIRFNMPKEFPKIKGIKINMMPFYIDYKDSLPEEYQEYWDIITICNQMSSDYYERNNTVFKGRRNNHVIKKIAYLTIEEGFILTGKTQRRPGLHIDSTRSKSISSTKTNNIRHWGRGRVHNNYSCDGGIYLASTVDDTCNIYPTTLINPNEVSMDNGDIENLRGMLGTPISTKKNIIYWITDCVPHEAMPMKNSENRQFFRLVTGELSVWYSQHSTPNPLCILPESMILNCNKFEQ